MLLKPTTKTSELTCILYSNDRTEYLKSLVWPPNLLLVGPGHGLCTISLWWVDLKVLKHLIGLGEDIKKGRFIS